MIIAAYAGCGKTTLANKYPDKCIEIPSMPYARILPEISEELPVDLEKEKAALYHVDNPLFPYNMVAAILEAEQESQFVIIPPAMPVINMLQRVYERTVVLCYPEDNLGEEYRRRFLERGNSEIFCELFADGLKAKIEVLKANTTPFHIVLGSHEFLTDKFDEIEEIYKSCPQNPVTCPEISVMYNIIKEKKKHLWFGLKADTRWFYYQIEDIEDAEEKQFIYNLGKYMFYKYEYGAVRVFESDVIRAYPL